MNQKYPIDLSFLKCTAFWLIGINNIYKRLTEYSYIEEDRTMFYYNTEF